MKKKKKWKIIIPIIIVIIIAARFSFGNNGDVDGANYVTTTEVVNENIESFVNASGVVLSKASYDVSSKITGEVISVGVKEGESVLEGQILCVLDDTAIKNQIRETEIQLSIAKENLLQILNQGSDNYEASYRNALLSKDNASKTYEETKELYDVGIYSKTELDNAYTAFIQSQNSYNELKIKYSGENNDSEVKIQELRIESLENSLSGLNKELSDTTIKSPIDGVVTSVDTKILSYVSPSVPVFKVEDMNKLKVEANISQYDIHKLALGQKVKIAAEGMSEVKFDGVISHIGSRAINKVLRQSQEMVIEVDVDIISEDTDLKPNYSAKIEIETASKDDVLVIPYEAVYIAKGGDKIVYTVEDGIAKAHIIDRGVEGTFKFQLLSDTITSGDSVILNPKESIQDGSQVIVTNAVESPEEGTKQ